MPLSEDEQRALAQIEQSLRASDARLARTLASGGAQLRARGLWVLAVLVGFAGIVAGIPLNSIPVAVAGFILALIAGVALARTGQQPAARDRRVPPRSGRRSLSDRAAERWDRRSNGEL